MSKLFTECQLAGISICIVIPIEFYDYSNVLLQSLVFVGRITPNFQSGSNADAHNRITHLYLRCNPPLINISTHCVQLSDGDSDVTVVVQFTSINVILIAFY